MFGETQTLYSKNIIQIQASGSCEGLRTLITLCNGLQGGCDA